MSTQHTLHKSWHTGAELYTDESSTRLSLEYRTVTDPDPVTLVDSMPAAEFAHQVVFRLLQSCRWAMNDAEWEAFLQTVRNQI